MSQVARVNSICAVQELQASFAQFCEDAKEALGAIDMEARRILDWLHHDQVIYWRKAILDREDDLVHAKADLFRRQLSRLSGDKPDCIEQEEAVWAADKKLQEAEEKLEKCKSWARQLHRAIDDYEAPARQLAALIEGQPPPCVVQLSQILATLEAYVAMTLPSVPAPAGPSVSAAGLSHESGKNPSASPANPQPSTGGSPDVAETTPRATTL